MCILLLDICYSTWILLNYIQGLCKNLRTPANILVINLAFSDFWIMVEAPFFIYNSIQQGPALGALACRLYGFLGAISGTVSIATLTAISLDRYNVVVYPLNPNRSATKIRCYIMIIIIWVYSAIFSIIPLLEIGLSKYTPEGFLTACSFDYLDASHDARLFMFIYFVAAWVVPLLTIGYCYVKILRVVFYANSSIQSNKNKNKTEIKLAFVVIGIVGLWFVAWTPYAIVSLLGILGYEDHLSLLGSMIPAVLAKTAACIDPYFYAMNHPRYRQELAKIFCRDKSALDQGNSEFQTSQYTRGATSIRRGRGESSEVETVTLGVIPKQNRGQLTKADSMISAADDTSLSFSVELTESTVKNNVNK